VQAQKIMLHQISVDVNSDIEIRVRFLWRPAETRQDSVARVHPETPAGHWWKAGIAVCFSSNSGPRLFPRHWTILCGLEARYRNLVPKLAPDLVSLHQKHLFVILIPYWSKLKHRGGKYIFRLNSFTTIDTWKMTNFITRIFRIHFKIFFN
jgi:hypothetical protein